MKVVFNPCTDYDIQASPFRIEEIRYNYFTAVLYESLKYLRKLCDDWFSESMSYEDIEIAIDRELREMYGNCPSHDLDCRPDIIDEVILKEMLKRNPQSHLGSWVTDAYSADADIRQWVLEHSVISMVVDLYTRDEDVAAADDVYFELFRTDGVNFNFKHWSLDKYIPKLAY